MSKLLSVVESADAASTVLNRSVAPAAIADLVLANALTNVSAKRTILIDSGQLSRFLAGVYQPSGIDVLRVSVSPVRADDALPTTPDGSTRTRLGVNLSQSGKSQLWQWTGLWPISARVADDAVDDELPLLATLKGFVRTGFARRIVGHRRDRTGTRRWFFTAPLPAAQKVDVFDGHPWAWIPVGRGPVARRQSL